MKILDRYIIRELAAPFFFGVAMFTAIFLGASILPQIAKLFIQGGKSIEVIWIFLLSLPAIIVVTFPMAMLLATLLGFGRLSSDAEVVSALASGISMRRLVAPVLIAAAFVSVVDFTFQEKVVPRSAGVANQLINRIRERTDVVSDRALAILVPEPEQGPPRLIAVANKLKLGASKGAAEEGTLYGVTVVYRNGQGAPELVANAREARYVPKLGRWRLYDVSYYYLPHDSGNGTHEVLAPVRSRENLIDFGKPPAKLRQSARPPDEMTVAELKKTIRNRLQAGMSTGEYEVQLHQRFAVPFAAVVFALIGAPLGLRRQRTASSLGLGLSVLIIFTYYILWHYLGTLGKGGAMDPMAAAWIPNLVGVIAGAILLQRAPK